MVQRLGPAPKSSSNSEGSDKSRAPNSKKAQKIKPTSPRRQEPQARTQGSRSLEVITALFVDRTPEGKLLQGMREAEKRLSTLTHYIIKIVEKNGVTFSQSLVQRDPFKGWDCCRDCGVCFWKPTQNIEEVCNEINLVYKGICTTCEEKENERLNLLKEADP